MNLVPQSALNQNRPVSRQPSGLTLIEVLVAMTMTLIVLSAMMLAFKFASKEMAVGRASIELSNQLRAAQELMRQDLAGVTVDVRPWMQTARPEGYWELYDGPGRDYAAQAPGSATVTVDSYLGDIDDVMAMTVRSSGIPYRGRFGGGIIESSAAEIIWFTVHNDRDSDGIVDFDESVDICRRVLLIRPDLPTVAYDPERLSTSDISYRIVDDGMGGYNLVPNSLADLGPRENRFAHREISAPLPPAVFPHKLNLDSLAITRSGELDAGGVLYFTGEDIVLAQAAGFDLRVYSPNTDIAEVSSTFLVGPGDFDFVAATASGTTEPLGGFVDLGDGTGTFSGGPTTRSGFLVNEFVYCTWSPHYEFGGQGLDGVDNDSLNGVDDVGERVTMPPYLEPIRGLQVSFRVVEKVTKQVRQAASVHSFVPE